MRAPLHPQRLQLGLARLTLHRAFEAARRVDYDPGSVEMAALRRAEAAWSRIKQAA